MGNILGKKVKEIKTGIVGTVVEGEVMSHDHILWEDGSRSDLTNALGEHSIEFLEEINNK